MPSAFCAVVVTFEVSVTTDRAGLSFVVGVLRIAAGSTSKFRVLKRSSRLFIDWWFGVHGIAVVRFIAGGEIKVMRLSGEVLSGFILSVVTGRGWRMYPDNTVLIAASVFASIVSKVSVMLLCITGCAADGDKSGRSGSSISSSGLRFERFLLHTPDASFGHNLPSVCTYCQ